MPNSRDRVTVKETVYHQIAGCNPTQVDSGYTHYLDDPEELWSRSPRKPLTQEWVPVDCGWIKKCFMMVIRNESDKNWIEFTYDPEGPSFLIPPVDVGQKATTRVYPSSVEKLLIRCVEGEARYSVFMVPG